MLFPVMALVLVVAGSPPQAGPWRLESSATKVKVLSWGLFCGQEPRDGRGVPGAVYALKPEGEDFTLQGAGRTLKSNGCGMDPETFKPRQRNHAGSSWAVECEGPDIAGQPQLSDHRYELLSPTELRYISKGDKRKNQAMDQCRFSFETELRFVLATEASRCAAPGPPQKLILDPASRDAAPGQRVCFKVQAVDAAGCGVEMAPPKFTVDPPDSADVDGNGCMWAPRRVDQALVLVVEATSGNARGGAVIRVLPKDNAAKESLQQTVARSRNENVRRLGSEVLAGEFVIKTPQEAMDEEAATAPMPAPAAPVVPPPAPSSIPWWPFALAGLLLAVGGAVVALRKPASKMPHVPNVAPATTSTLAWKCPVCGFEYAHPGTCRHDGAALVGKVTKARATMFIPEVGGMKCPTCGQKYPTRAKFCGNDRTPLVADTGA